MRRVVFGLLALVLLSIIGIGGAAATSPPGDGSQAGPSPAATPGASARPSSKPAHTPAAKASPGGKLPQMVIVVTATRLPEPLGQVGTTTSVVAAPTIQAQQIASALDALREVPGVQVAQSGSPGSLGEVFIRGAPPDRILF